MQHAMCGYNSEEVWGVMLQAQKCTQADAASNTDVQHHIAGGIAVQSLTDQQLVAATMKTKHPVSVSHYSTCNW